MTAMAPFFELGAFGASVSLLFAVGIGIAFGVALERAGLGDARKLANQFYARDFTVLKVMFSTIVTAMLGVFWLSRAGILDLARIYVPETFLAPQIVGGLLFGAGFVIVGLCPGTACVAAASGSGDGLAAIAGLFTGVLGAGLAYAAFRGFYESGARGAFTLPQVFGASYGVVVFAIVVLALFAFAVAERMEARA
jgi:uncharacterized protein